MKKQEIALRISLLTFGLFFVMSNVAGAEVIKSFDSQIFVNTDSSIRVVETIIYDSQGLEKHGIFRDITPRSAEGTRIDIDNVSVVDVSGQSMQWQRQNNNGDVRLKIGDPNITFVGEKTYTIEYTATNTISHLELGIDEIYWNVTGSSWPFSIERATATVVLPDSAIFNQSSCYIGSIGSTEKCSITNDKFYSSRALSPGEGMTIAAGFPAGFVFDYVPTFKEKVFIFIGKFWPIVIPVLVFIFMFKGWHRKGRDAKGTGTIVAQYDVIDNVTPLEASVIMTQKFTGVGLVAEILFLATKGYITITQTQEKEFLGKKIDYTLNLKNLPDYKLTTFDQQLIKEIFDPKGDSALLEGTTVTLSQSYSLFGITTSLSTKIKERLVEHGYYTKDFLPKSINMSLKKFITIVLWVGIVGFFGLKYIATQTENLTSIFFGQGPWVVVIFIVSQFVAVGILAFFKGIMPAKTKKGVLAREQLLGLKEYIKVAEKDRIAFHNAPEMNATLFETLLPYAVMFGLEKKWAKAFEGIALPPPSWYSSNGSSFAPAVFVSDFSNNFSSSFFNAPVSSSGGSSGGGSSGGGGGGGGGGSW